MKKFLWQGGGQPSGSDTVDEAIIAFTAGEDVILDRELFIHDIRATAAHVRGLERIGILDAGDSARLCALLNRLSQEFHSGEFVLDQQFEDGHSAIEAYLQEHAGALGERVHTGRSRNDQVAVAIRLFMLDGIRKLAGHCSAIAHTCLDQAQAHEFVPMPGYTHLQRAVPSSIGLWMGGFAEAFTDDIDFALSVLDILDACPLGTAAGYGVNLPLDRDGMAAELGFGRLQLNPMAVQNARGKFELMCLQAALHAMLDLRRLAWDLSLFTTSEFNLVRLPPGYSTGSSIMPNKSNPDVVELLRARAATIEGAIAEIQSVLSLPSGYHRDVQLTKAPLVRGLQATLQALAIVPGLVAGLEFNQQAMRDAITPDMFSTDRALEQAAAGVPFRQAYRTAKSQPAETASGSTEQSLAARVSKGACGDLQLEMLRSRLVTSSLKIEPA